MSDKHHDKKLSRVLSDLKAEYLTALPEKIKRIRSLTENESWDQIYDEYHKLKGTGKTYGFPEISTVCEKLEILAQKKETQKKALFLEAAGLLEDIHKAFISGKNFDLENHPFSKTLLKSGRKK